MAKLTELPSDDDSTPHLSNKGGPRKNTTPEEFQPKEPKTKTSETSSLKNTTGTIYVNYVLVPLTMVIISVVFLYTTQYDNNATKTSILKKKGILMTASELAKHDGSDPNIPIYIAILGRVYDVDKGKRHYGIGSGYHVFAGRDSTPCFVTGKFSREEATDDISGLTPEEMLSVKGWMDFYRKDYTYVGRVIGRFYDENGKPTDELKEAKKKIKEGEKLKEKEEDEKKKFPPCNSKWAVNVGSEVWCSSESGGIKRSWIGVPRQYFKPGSSSAVCVCIRTTGPSTDKHEGDRGDLDNPNLKPYPDCEETAILCKFKS